MTTPRNNPPILLGEVDQIEDALASLRETQGRLRLRLHTASERAREAALILHERRQELDAIKREVDEVQRAVVSLGRVLAHLRRLNGRG
jgi:chromosome segregation ATPase